MVCSLDWIALLQCVACGWLPLAIRLWIAPGCAAARSSSRSSLIPSFEDCSFHSCVSRKCRRLRLYAVPCAVRLLYDLGVLALFVTLARSHVFWIGFSTRTVCCGDRGTSSFAGRSRYDCRCWRNAFTSPFDRDDTAGKFDLYHLPFRSSHGDGRLWSIGVDATQHRQVRVATAFLHLSENLFHCLHCSLYESIRPRIQRDGRVTWSNRYLTLKTRNSSDLYCEPLSETSLSGIPCSSKIPLQWLIMIVLELMVVSFCMIGNLLYKSTISRYSVPFQWNRSVALSGADTVARCQGSLPVQ